MRIVADETSKIKIIMDAGEELTIVNEDSMPIQAWGQSIEGKMEHKLIKVEELRVAEL
ncbi:hypothetical protein LCGC14_1710840 [marine sediment metagenome]|uniref:Uncharacterized protein n=1 Tax=marine sediment metagenome TaxID=412755 RepID=A0A0F9JVN7_9ZZZZ